MCMHSWICNVHAFMGIQRACIYGYAMWMHSWISNVHALMGMHWYTIGELARVCSALVFMSM